jgi:hypothetical protein
MHAETHSEMGRDELARHERMYRRFVWGSGLFAAHVFVILLVLYYFFA